MTKLIKWSISLAGALIAGMLAVPGVALVKAVVPIFALTAGTRFEVYIQDPVLFSLGPLFCGYLAFRAIMSWLGAPATRA